MSIKLLQHFDNFETFSLNGNAAMSNVHKFGTKSASFTGMPDYIAISNNSEIFNLYPLCNRNFECFFMPTISQYASDILNSSAVLSFNGHSFFLAPEPPLTWQKAKSFCEALGGHLPTSTSAEKNNFLYYNFFPTSTYGLWLGGSDEGHEGVWTWITGEEWSYSNWWNGQPDNENAQQHFLCMYNGWGGGGRWMDSYDMWEWNVACEWDFDVSELITIPGNIFNFDNLLSLAVNYNSTLQLSIPSLNIDVASNATVTNDIWHHVSLRFHNNSAYVYLDGLLVISAECSDINISPASFSLGGFSGYLDEFALHDDCNAPLTPPNSPYYSSINKSSAPVTRVNWSCNNLPDGLILSPSGLLSGHPTTAGTFDCNVSVNTNWGTDNKILRIVIN